MNRYFRTVIIVVIFRLMLVMEKAVIPSFSQLWCPVSVPICYKHVAISVDSSHSQYDVFVVFRFASFMQRV